MTEERKRKRRPDTRARLSRAQHEKALEDTFPASDPISAEQPVSSAAGCGVAKT